MGVWCEYCGQQMTSAPSHAEHIEDDCQMRPDRLLEQTRDALLAIKDFSGPGSLSRARATAEALLPRIEQCLKRAPWNDQYKP